MTVIGSASINIRADDKYFEPDVRRAVAKIKDIRLAVKVDADMSAANKKIRDLRYRMSKNEVSIGIRADDSKFESDLRAAASKVKSVKVAVDADMSPTNKKIRDLRYRLKNNPASIKVEADSVNFESSVRTALRKIRNLGVELRVDADTSAASKKIRDLRYRLTNNDIAIKIRANDANFDADVRAAVRKIRNVQIGLKADVDIANASKKIRDLRYRITSKDAILKVDANVAKAEEKMRKLLEKFTNSEVNITAKAHTEGAHTLLSDLQSRYGGTVNYVARANTSIASAQLAHAARTRRAKIVAAIDPATMNALKGAFNTLTGTLPFEKVQSSLFGVIGAFEGIAVKAALVSTALLSVGAVALTAGANILSIAGDITQVVGIAAMLPAAFITMGVAIATTKMAWKGFGEALSSDPKKAAAAMAELPPEAQRAADGVRGLGKEIQKATQAKFWEALGTSLQDMVTNLLPQAKEGFEYVGAALGTLQAVTFDNISKGLGDGVLLGIMTNIGDMFTNMTKGTGDFIQGVTTLGRVGATYLPQFGTYLGDAGTKFGEFIRKADEAGKINVWIETAVRRFQELGSIVKSTVGIVSGLTEVARMSGAPGLTQMADGFKNIAAVVNSEPFQGQLLNILEGARTGTGRLGEGLSTLTELFWSSSASVESFLIVAGEIAGLTFKNITALFDGTGLGSGLIEALLGLKDGMGQLGPGFSDLGTAIGDLGEIAGTLFRSMAPGLNMLAETIAGVVGGLKDGFIDAMPVFNEFIQLLLSAASGPIVAFAGAIGNLLSGFSELPGAIQNVIMAMGLMLLLRPKFDKFFGGLSKSLASENSRMGNYWRNVKDEMSGVRTHVGTAADNMAASLRNSFSASATAAKDSFGVIRTGVGEMGSEVKRAATGAGTSIKGAFKDAAAATSRSLAPMRAGIRDALVNDSDLGQVSKGFGRMSDEIGRHMGNASARVHNLRLDVKDVASGIGTDFKGGTGAVKDQFRDMGTYASGTARQMSAAVKTEAKIMATDMGNMARSVDNSLKNIPSRVGSTFAGMGQSVGRALGDVGKSWGNAFTNVSSSIGASMGTVGAKVAAALAPVAGHAQTASGKVVGAFANVGTRVNGSLSTISGSAARMAAGMDAALAPARRAMSDLATHAANVGGAVGKGLGKGVGLAASGLMGALGGGWGLAIAGATVAVAAWSKAQQESKARVEELTDVITDQAGKLGDAGAKMLTNNLMDGATSKWDDFWRGSIKGAKSVEESFDELGVSLGDVGKKLADPSSRDKYAKGWQDISDAVNHSRKPTEEMMKAVGLTNEELGRLNNNDIGHLNGQLQGVAEEARKAEIHAKQLADAHGTAEVTGARLAANYDILGQKTSSVSDKTAALKDNLEILSKGTMSTLDANSRYHESLRGTNDQLKELAANNNGTLAGLTGIKGGFDVASAAGNDLYKTMETHRDSILEMGMATMQNAINNGESISVAKARAVESMMASTETLKQSLIDLGIDATTAQQMLDTLGLNPEKLTGALVMKNDEANFNIAQSALAANAYAQGNYAAALTAMPQAAKDAILSVTDYLDAYKSGGWEAVLTAINATGAVPEEVLASLISITDKDHLAKITAEDLSAPAFNSAILAGGTLEAIDTAIALTAEDKTKAGFASADANINSWEDLKTVTLETKDGYSVPLALASAELRAKWINSPDGQLALKTIDEAEGGVNPALLKVKSFADYLAIASLQAKDDSAPGMSDADAAISGWEANPSFRGLMTKSEAAAGLAQANGEVDPWERNPALKDIRTNNMAGDGIAMANGQVISDFVGVPGMKDLMTQNMAGEGISSATGSVFSDWVHNPVNYMGLYTKDEAAPGVLSAKNTVESGLAGIAGAGGGGGLGRGISMAISAEDLAAYGTASAANTMNTGVTDVTKDIFVNNSAWEGTSAASNTMNTGVTDVTKGIFANNNTWDGTIGAQGTMSSLPDIWRGLFATNNTGGATGEAQGTMSTLGDVWRGLFAGNYTGGATGAAQGTMGSLSDVWRGLFANNNTGGGLNSSQGTMNSLQNVTRDLSAANKTAGGKGAAQGTMNSLQNVIRDLTAANKAAAGRAAAQGTMNSLDDVSRDLRANNHAWDGVRAAQGAINSLVGRTVDVVTRFFSKHENANGGVYGDDGTKVFADGGILKGTRKQAVKAFAGGGIENHTAQIARGAWPVRVWAEPETGGEAYIPLSKNKRKRSLDILEVVMAEFGIQGMMNGKAFANGGIERASRYTTPSVVSSRYAATAPQTTTILAGAPNASGATPPQVHIHPSAGLSEEQIGQVAADRLWFNIQNSTL